jgi:hypothetical protein
MNGFRNQKASEEDQQAQAPEDAEEDALAAATQVAPLQPQLRGKR